MSALGGYRSYASDELVTGEGVAVELPVAGLGSRIVSAVIDLILSFVVCGVGLYLVSISTSSHSRAVIQTWVIAWTVVSFVLLPTGMAMLSRGKSLGKLIMGLRVVRDDGGPIGSRHALTRALIGVVETFVMLGAPAIISAFVNTRGKRLGDMAAGTYVITERAPLRLALPPMTPRELQPWANHADMATLPDGLAVAVRQFLHRAPGLNPQSRFTLGQDLLSTTLRYVSPAPPPGHHPESVLAAVISERRDRDSERLRREDALRARVLPTETF